MPVLMRETTRDTKSQYVGYKGIGSLGAFGDESSVDWGTFSMPDSTPSIPSGGGFNWGDLLTYGVKSIATPILNSQFGGPQPGQYFANQKTGQVAYNVPQGSSINAFPGVNFSAGNIGSFLPWILVIGGGILALKMIGGKH